MRDPWSGGDQSCAFLGFRYVVAGFVPDAISTVNGSPVRRAPLVTFTSISPAPSSSASSARGVNPSQRSPRRSRTHVSPCSRRSSTSTRPPGTRMRTASRKHPRRIFGVMQRLREQRHVDRCDRRSAASRASPRFQVTLETRRRAASARARLSTSGDRSMAITCAAQRLVSIVR